MSVPKVIKLCDVLRRHGVWSVWQTSGTGIYVSCSTYLLFPPRTQHANGEMVNRVVLFSSVSLYDIVKLLWKQKGINNIITN